MQSVPVNMNLCFDLGIIYELYDKKDKKLTADALNIAWNDFGTRYRFHEYNYPHKGYHKINDVFMLGEKILAAPAVKKGKRKKPFYFLPENGEIRTEISVTAEKALLLILRLTSCCFFTECRIGYR